MKTLRLFVDDKTIELCGYLETEIHYIEVNCIAAEKPFFIPSATTASGKFGITREEASILLNKDALNAIGYIKTEQKFDEVKGFTKTDQKFDKFKGKVRVSDISVKNNGSASCIVKLAGEPMIF